MPLLSSVLGDKAKPNYHMLKSVGCACWPLLHPYNARKLSFRSKECVFIGYSGHHKGYKCLDVATGQVYISRDVIFDEQSFPFSRLDSSQNSPSYTYESLLDLGNIVSCTNDRINVQNPVIFPHAGSPAAGVPGDHVDNVDHVPQPRHARPSADSDAAHVGSASPSSSPAPSSLSSSTSSQVVIVPPAPHREHRMQTRLRVGKTVPIQRTDGTVTYSDARVVDGEPLSVRAALQTPAWKATMDVEYSALQRNQT